eukprot:1067003-Prymnesium_polylepis.1
MRAVRVYLRAIASAWRDADEEERKRQLLTPVYAWITWFKKSPCAVRPKSVTDGANYIHRLVEVGANEYGIPADIPLNLKAK